MDVQFDLPNEWDPRAYQWPLWDFMWNGGKRAIAVWHRRAGKDDVCLHWTAVSIMTRPPANYWHMLPEYAQGRRAIWTAMNAHTGKRRIDEAFPHALRETTNEQEMFIRFKNGATWQVVGSDRYDSAVGSAPYGIVFSEWALSDPASWAYLAPILLENDGWALFITTSRGRNHAKSMLDMARDNPNWFAETLTVDDTKFLNPAIIEAQRKEYHGIYGEEAGNALIDQEYYCSFEAAVLGAYWGKEMRLAEQEGRIRDLDIAIDLPVNTAWDIGIDDAMAIWCFQVYPDRIHLVDYIEDHGKGFDYYCELLDKRGYHGTDYVPHDAKVREPGAPGARTRIETLIAMKRKPVLVPNESLMDGISAARKTLPFCHFDKTRCAKGLEALREYKTEWDEKARAFKKTPAHNWASHSADSFRYMSLGWRAPARPAEKPPEPVIKPLTKISLDELLAFEDDSGKKDRV